MTMSHTGNDTSSLNDRQRIALDFLSRGWAVMPTTGKEAINKGWSKAPSPTPEQVVTDFADPSRNVAVRLGSISGGLADIDYDRARAVTLAPEFFPATGLEFGRESQLRSHRGLRVNADFIPYQKFNHPDGGKPILEIGGDGHYTVFPGSVHAETGEPITWSVGSDGNPATVDLADLQIAASADGDGKLGYMTFPWDQGRERPSALLAKVTNAE